MTLKQIIANWTVQLQLPASHITYTAQGQRYRNYNHVQIILNNHILAN